MTTFNLANIVATSLAILCGVCHADGKVACQRKFEAKLAALKYLDSNRTRLDMKNELDTRLEAIDVRPSSRDRWFVFIPPKKKYQRVGSGYTIFIEKDTCAVDNSFGGE
jgi:hypothetical protein